MLTSLAGVKAICDVRDMEKGLAAAEVGRLKSRNALPARNVSYCPRAEIPFVESKEATGDLSRFLDENKRRPVGELCGRTT